MEGGALFGGGLGVGQEADGEGGDEVKEGGELGDKKLVVVGLVSGSELVQQLLERNLVGCAENDGEEEEEKGVGRAGGF